MGGDKNKFARVYWNSFDASIFEVCCKYFNFSTNIISGIPGKLFPLLSIAPLAIFAYDYRQGKLSIECLSMYIVFFLTCISWFVLAKSHSYIHTHMNYVLWYFGFVQICLYVCTIKCTEIYKNINKGIKR